MIPLRRLIASIFQQMSVKKTLSRMMCRPENGGLALGGEDSFEKQATRGDDTNSVQKALSQGRQYCFGSRLFEEPVMEGLDEGGDLLGGKGDGVGIEVILQAEGCTAGRMKDQMAGGVGQCDSQLAA